MGLRVVVGAVGAVVGGIIGGPSGAQLGWALGSVAGNVIDPPVSKGPALGDIATQTSSEGGAIPITFNMTPPIAGNVIATSSPIVLKQKSGGKKGKVESEVVYRTYAIGVCEGPIEGFMRVWRNNKLVFDASSQGLVSDEDNQEFIDNTEIYTGTYDQEASPALEAIFGVGTTASHRGIAYMVRVKEDVNDMQGACAQWAFQTGPDDFVLPPTVKLTGHSASVVATYPTGATSFVEIGAYFAITFDYGTFRIGTTGNELTYAYGTYESIIDGVLAPRPAAAREVVPEGQWYQGPLPPSPDEFEIRITWSGSPPPLVDGYPLVGSGDEALALWQPLNGNISVSFYQPLPGSKGGAFSIRIRRKATGVVLAGATISLSVNLSISP